MPEEGFSIFEIQTPLENSTLHKPKGSPESCKFRNPLFIFQTQNGQPLNTWGGGRSYGRLGLPSISATRKSENTKK